jgi:hypothetical protein
MLERSRANAEKNRVATLEKYWENGYSSYFAWDDRTLVRQDDGTYKLKRNESVIGNALKAMGVKLPERGGLNSK